MTVALDPAQLAATAQRAALAGGKVLADRRGQPVEITLKDARVDVTSPVDLAAQRAVAAEIRAVHPDHRVVGEEPDGSLDAGHPDQPVWYVDPLDGTRNYLNGVGYFCTSVAVAHDGTVLAGAVYDPTADELFTATRGRGAQVNGVPLRVAGTPGIERALLVTQAQSADPAVIAGFAELMATLMNASGGVRFPGAPALVLAHVAAGRYTGYVERTMDPWDVAAGRLLVEEAGGRISDFAGRPAPVDQVVDLVATNGHIHDALLAVLSGADRHREDP